MKARSLMRYLLLLVIVLFIAGCCWDGRLDEISDPNLKSAIREEMDALPGVFTDLEDLNHLYASDRGISELTGIENCINLECLFLDFNQINDISPLSNLTKLWELYLDSNRIIDISPLSGLNKLDFLWLNANQIIDISPLSELINLLTVELKDNRISDISPLARNSGLGEGDKVDLRGNPLNDEAYDVHIPTLQKRGVEVLFDPKL